jgi:hypothetical protein
MTKKENKVTPPVSTANKTNRYDITEILLKVALNTIQSKPKPNAVGVYRFMIPGLYSNQYGDDKKILDSISERYHGNHNEL